MTHHKCVVCEEDVVTTPFKFVEGGVAHITHTTKSGKVYGDKECGNDLKGRGE